MLSVHVKTNEISQTDAASLLHLLGTFNDFHLFCGCQSDLVNTNLMNAKPRACRAVLLNKHLLKCQVVVDSKNFNQNATAGLSTIGGPNR